MIEIEIFSPAAKRAVELAGRLAAAMQAPETTPRQLLSALLVEESHASKILERSGADLSRIRTELDATIDDEGLPPAPNADATVSILRNSKQIAAELGSTVGTAELLAALAHYWLEDPALADEFSISPLDVLSAYDDEQLPPAIEPIEVAGLSLNVDDVTEHADIARILDANANRATEALRVLEDYARFSRNDPFLAGKCKSSRHELQEALAFLPSYDRRIARETSRDVGVNLSQGDDHQRQNLSDLLVANASRAQEAIRSLEEYAKLESRHAARLLEKLRYNLYTLDRLLVIGQRSQQLLGKTHLYWLFDPDATEATMEWAVERAIEGGVQVVQLRYKQASDRELLSAAESVRRWTAKQNVLFIVNDRPDIARLVGADGVHLGQDDMPVMQARRIVGTSALIGVSTHNISQGAMALQDGADYLGVGPVFASRTKEFHNFAGLDYVRQAHAEFGLPMFCIGGIHEKNVHEILTAGGLRIAVSNAISSSEDPYLPARSLRTAIDPEVK